MHCAMCCMLWLCSLAVAVSEENAILGLVVIDLFNVIATLGSVKYLDSLPRKTWLLAGSPGMGVSLLLLAAVFSMDPGGLQAPLALLSLICYVLCFCVSWGPLGWLINSEIYPLSARGMCTGLSTTTCWVANYFVSMTFLSMVEMFGRSESFMVYAGFCVAAYFFVKEFVPETRGKTLEEIEQILRAAAMGSSSSSSDGVDGGGVGGGGGGGSGGGGDAGSLKSGLLESDAP